MKKITLLFVALCLLGLPLYADNQIESVISTEGTATADLEPDTVKIRFYVENQGTNLTDLKAKNDKIVSESIKAIKAQLKENEQVRTISFRVNNIYSYKDKIRIFQKYEVVNGFEVKLKDLSKTATIIKLAMDNGVKRVDNLNFYLENTENYCNSMMIEATKIAKARAYKVASAAGSEILKVKSINPYCSLNQNNITRRLYTNAMMKSSADSAGLEEASESIEPGTISARAGVNITYYLK